MTWIDAIDHIQITTSPDLQDEMRFFYGTLLGLTPLEQPKSLQNNGIAWYQLGHIQLHISTEKDATNYASRRHICFRVQSLSAFRQHLSTHNIDIIPDQQPIEEYDRFYLRDPGGNRIEVAALKQK
ncbi:MAG: VOC family protein [Plectolyngbya sp. WJT66-NPBG17]|jgi:catechol-2,3-dioxygenase|nr:VOC family protein [Plectolyngbya sp. WJT66-NPBG17]